VSALSLNKLRTVDSLAGDIQEQLQPCALAIEGVGRRFWRSDRLPLPVVASNARAIGLAVTTLFGRISIGIKIDGALASTLPFPSDRARSAHGWPRFPARFPEHSGFRHNWFGTVATVNPFAAVARGIEQWWFRVVTLPSTSP
jgi:hypothetical protein